MSTNYKKAILQAEIEGILKDLSVQSHSDIVAFDDGKSLTTKIAEIIADVATKASTDDLDARIDTLVNGAPEALDTLKEVADAITANESIMDALNEAIGDKVSKEGYVAFTEELKTKLESLSSYDDTEVRGLIADKVSKVAGKGLSTNDYSNDDKEKLSALENYDDTGIRSELASKVTFRIVE